MNRVNDPLTEWVLGDPAARGPMALMILGALIVLPLLIFAVYCFRLGTRAAQQGRFPPAGYRLMRAATPVTGTAAVRQGRILRIVAMILIVFALAMAIVVGRFAVLLARYNPP